MYTEEKKAMGAIPNDPDVRDISIFDLPIASGELKMKNITDISMLPVNDQKRLGTCVAEALTKYKQYKAYKETGKIIDFSQRIPYRLGRNLSGIPDYFEGSRTRDVLKSMVSMGCPTTEVLEEDKDLSHADYLSFEFDEKMAESGSPNAIEGFAFVPANINSITMAIDYFELCSMVVAVGDWRRIPVKAPKEGDTGYYTHEILVYGYERVKNDLKIFFLNSWGDGWGKNGCGELFLSDFTKNPGHIFDISVIADIPQDVLKEVRGRNKKPQVRFDSEVKYGDRGQSVTDLQLCLRYEGLYGLDAKIDGMYGPKTAKALQGFQERYATGTLSSISIGQGRRLGTKDRETINYLYRLEVNSNMYSDKIIAWAKAIQQKEGYFAPSIKYPKGSRAWRNNNPGNIKYYGLFANLAKGRDDANFCIFATYEDGLNALCLLLKRAATGVSSVYRPEMSLLQFYQKYAPSSDNNNPRLYAEFVADKIGVSVDTPIKNLLS